jgi:hypothetical protein
MEALEHAAEEAEDLLSGPAGPRTRRRPSSGKMYMWWAIGGPGGSGSKGKLGVWAPA